VTSHEFSRMLTLMGITQIELSKKIDHDERSIRRWVAGKSPVPTPVALLLNLMFETETELEDLR
jgi:plasmid maintenance system antidote protein VapI